VQDIKSINEIDSWTELTVGQKIVLVIIIYDTLSYLGLFGYACFNSYHFLYRQKRYKIFLLSAFYVLTFIIALSRILYLILQIFYGFHMVTTVEAIQGYY